MGFKRQDALIESRLQDRTKHLSEFIILNWLCRRTNDNAPPDEIHKFTREQLLDETPLSEKTVRRRLTTLKERGLIRFSESEGRYGKMYEAVIIDHAYIDALQRIQRKHQSKASRSSRQDTAPPLVSGHAVHSQDAAPPLVNGHAVHSQEHQGAGASPQSAGNGHTVHSNGHAVHSHTKKKKKGPKKEGKKQKYLEQINNLLDPSFLPIQKAPELKPDAKNLIRNMLKHPEICIDSDYITPLTRAYGPGRIFFACCHYLDDRRRGTIDGPGALIHRLADPERFPAPKPCASDYGNSLFYSEFRKEVYDYRDKIDRLEWEREESEVNFCNDNDQTPNTDGASPPITDQTPASPTIEADRIWSETLRELELILPAATFADHLRGTSALHYQGGRLTIKALNVYSQNMLRDRLRSKIEDVLKQVAGHPVQAYYTSPDQPDPETETPQDMAGTATLSPPPLGGSDASQVDAAPDPTDALSPPAAEPEPQTPDETNHFRQAQDTDREFRQDKIKHSQRRRT